MISSSGVYVLFDENSNAVYVGQSRVIGKRVFYSIRERGFANKKCYVSILLCDKEELNSIEYTLIKYYESNYLLNKAKIKFDINNYCINRINFIEKTESHLLRHIILSNSNREKIVYNSIYAGGKSNMYEILLSIGKSGSETFIRL